MDVQATRLRPGMLVKFNGQLHTIYRVEHRTPGNKRGFVQSKMRNHRSGSMIDHKFSSEDMIEKVALDSQAMEYLYAEGDQYTFMNTSTYEQTALSAEMLGDVVSYLSPNAAVTVQFYEGNPLTVDLPQEIVLIVEETEPAIKGATVTNVTKPAKTETGLVVQVPGFIKEGEKIRVSTSDGSYMSRA